ncbi:uncharacterized protein Aud_009382 [Aspergillus udagawae]|uniref:Uncharacterized protein n=1 Tax=Aspergillus udagawae TaxID=91492 RepID=A0A8E0V3Z2_9EURO|nr:uncharacterized protein Aud_009382 [Aspergillus udagawae]GIC92905.1 hypothetical protein Aud_009382 [Aspergillus udagawae]
MATPATPNQEDTPEPTPPVTVRPARTRPRPGRFPNPRHLFGQVEPPDVLEPLGSTSTLPSTTRPFSAGASSSTESDSIPVSVMEFYSNNDAAASQPAAHA